jgi:hypothetical protein
VKGYHQKGVAAAWRLDSLSATSTADGQSSTVVRSSLALSADTGKAFTGTLAIALGLGTGVAIVRLCKQKEAEEV